MTPGDTVDRFVVEARVGDGWRARDPRTGSSVRLRFIEPWGEPAAFVGGARMLAGIEGPNLLGLVEAGVDPTGRAWVVDSWVPGETLAERIARCGRIPREPLLALAEGLLAGLAAAHARGISDGAITPDRVLIIGEPPTSAALVNPGLASLVADYDPAPDFAPPEGSRATVAADLFGVATTICYAAVGIPVPPGQVLEEAAAFLPAPLLEALAQCLDSDPRDRPHSAEPLRRTVEALRAGTLDWEPSVDARPRGLIDVDAATVAPDTGGVEALVGADLDGTGPTVLPSEAGIDPMSLTMAAPEAGMGRTTPEAVPANVLEQSRPAPEAPPEETGWFTDARKMVESEAAAADASRTLSDFEAAEPSQIPAARAAPGYIQAEPAAPRRARRPATVTGEGGGPVRPPLAMYLGAGALLLLGIGAVVLWSSLRDPPVAAAPPSEPAVRAPSTASPPPSAPPPVAPATLALSAPTRPAGPQPSRQDLVRVTVEPGPARFVQVPTNNVLCEEATSCMVPIDVETIVEREGYGALRLSGDDLYDRRGGRWLVKLYPNRRRPKRRR